MKKLLILVLIIAFMIITFMVISSINSAFEVDDLWQKAQAMAENSWRLVPGQVTTTIISSSDNDEASATTSTTVYTTFLGEDGTIVSEKLEDNAHISQSEIVTTDTFSHSHETALDFSQDDLRAALSSVEGLGNLDDLLNNPNVRVMSFSGDQMPDLAELQTLGVSNVQMHEIDSSAYKIETGMDLTPKRGGIFFEESNHNLTLRKLRGRKTIDGRLSQGYSFKWTPAGSSERQDGIIWLDIATGAPILQEIGSPKKIFSPSSVSTIINYGYNEDTNHFFVSRKEENTSISVPVVGINLNIHTTRLEENHWEYQPED